MTGTRQGALATYRTPRRAFGGAFCVLFGWLAALAAMPPARALAQGTGDVIVARGVKIRMRTGAPLSARVYRVAGPPRPTIFALENDTTAARERKARALAAAGFVVVIADPRPGDDKHVGRDGADAIEWIGAQSWSDRHIVVEGTGDGANAAWNTARERPSLLAAMFTRAPSRVPAWTDQQFGDVAVPSLVLGGELDEPQGAAVATYARYTRGEALGAPRLAYLVIGRMSDDDITLMEGQYFAWTLGHGSPPPLLRGRVNYMSMDDGAWHSAPSLDGVGAVQTSYPLHTNAGPRSAPVGFLGDLARDEEPADTLTTGVKTYETTLRAAQEVAGVPAVTLWVEGAASAPAEASLEEVRPDGSVVELGRSPGVAVRPDSEAAGAHGPARWEFDAFGFIATKLAAGSTLRLTIRVGAGAIIYHDTDNYSRVILPVVRRER